MEPTNTRHPGIVVHEVLAHSYVAYLGAAIFGFVLEVIFPVHLPHGYLLGLGMGAVVLGTALVFWAQSATRERPSVDHVEPHGVKTEDFLTGPYRYTRTPTQLGLFFMVLGLSMLYYSVFMIAATVLAFVISHIFLIPKEEAHLEQKYGQPYADYKKQVRF